MALRREIMGYIGTGAIGGIVGYYVGAKEVLGIQSETSPSETETSLPQTETSPPQTETSQTNVLIDEDFRQGLTDWEVLNPSGWEDRNITPAEINESNQFEGSIKTTVDGAPSGVRFNRPIGSVPSGTAMSVELYSPTYTDSSQIGSLGGGIVIALQSQTAGDTRIWNLGDSGKEKLADNNGHGEFNVTVSNSYPEDTILSIWTKTWPGRVTFFYKRVTMRP